MKNELDNTSNGVDHSSEGNAEQSINNLVENVNQAEVEFVLSAEILKTLEPQFKWLLDKWAALPDNFQFYDGNRPPFTLKEDETRLVLGGSAAWQYALGLSPLLEGTDHDYFFEGVGDKRASVQANGNIGSFITKGLYKNLDFDFEKPKYFSDPTTQKGIYYQFSAKPKLTKATVAGIDLNLKKHKIDFSVGSFKSYSNFQIGIDVKTGRRIYDPAISTHKNDFEEAFEKEGKIITYELDGLIQKAQQNVNFINPSADFRILAYVLNSYIKPLSLGRPPTFEENKTQQKHFVYETAIALVNLQKYNPMILDWIKGYYHRDYGVNPQDFDLVFKCANEAVDQHKAPEQKTKDLEAELKAAQEQARKSEEARIQQTQDNQILKAQLAEAVARAEVAKVMVAEAEAELKLELELAKAKVDVADFKIKAAEDRTCAAETKAAAEIKEMEERLVQNNRFTTLLKEEYEKYADEIAVAATKEITRLNETLKRYEQEFAKRDIKTAKTTEERNKKHQEAIDKLKQEHQDVIKEFKQKYENDIQALNEKIKEKDTELLGKGMPLENFDGMLNNFTNKFLGQISELDHRIENDETKQKQSTEVNFDDTVMTNVAGSSKQAQGVESTEGQSAGIEKKKNKKAAKIIPYTKEETLSLSYVRLFQHYVSTGAHKRDEWEALAQSFMDNAALIGNGKDALLDAMVEAGKDFPAAFEGVIYELGQIFAHLRQIYEKKPHAAQIATTVFNRILMNYCYQAFQKNGGAKKAIAEYVDIFSNFLNKPVILDCLAPINSYHIKILGINFENVKQFYLNMWEEHKKIKELLGGLQHTSQESHAQFINKNKGDIFNLFALQIKTKVIVTIYFLKNLIKCIYYQQTQNQTMRKEIRDGKYEASIHVLANLLSLNVTVKHEQKMLKDQISKTFFQYEGFSTESITNAVTGENVDTEVFSYADDFGDTVIDSDFAEVKYPEVVSTCLKEISQSPLCQKNDVGDGPGGKEEKIFNHLVSYQLIAGKNRLFFKHIQDTVNNLTNQNNTPLVAASSSSMVKKK